MKRSDRIAPDTVLHQTGEERVIQTRHDLTPILKANEFQRSEQSLHHREEVFNHAARISPLHVREWCKERGITKDWYRLVFGSDQTLLKAYLNDPQNEKFRTRKGKI